MPTIPKGNRDTLATKSRQDHQAEKERAFKGIDRSNAPFYKSRHWQKLRLFILQRDVICKHCSKDNRYITATVCDHIQPILKGGNRYDVTNLQALCSSCHNKKSARDK